MSLIDWQQPNSLRLRGFLDWLRRDPLREPLQLNPATWYARHRGSDWPPAGCLFGHYVARVRPGPISLEPIAWKDQVKVPGLKAELLAEYPCAEWQHYTLAYHSPGIESYGLAAVGLFLRLRPVLVRQLLMPFGPGYGRLMSADSLSGYLAQILGDDPCIQSSLPYSDPC